MVIYFAILTTKIFIGYGPDLINIKRIINNTFRIEKPIENCGQHLIEDEPADVIPSLYKSCFCCGEKYNPNPSLNCPVPYS
jgi:hypothetical protein